MKKVMKSVLGVTLLEVMLVLAVAAMIIVMSVRYYQSASANQQTNSALQMIQGIAAAADGLAQSTGAYNNPATIVNAANIAAQLPNNSLVLPWGSTATFGAVTASTYVVNFPTLPAQVCRQLSSRLAGNPKFTAVTAMATCGTSGTAANFTYRYDSTK